MLGRLDPGKDATEVLQFSNVFSEKYAKNIQRSIHVDLLPPSPTLGLLFHIISLSYVDVSLPGILQNSSW